MKKPLAWIAALAFAACSAAPVPADKTTYVGTWKGVGIELTITADGGLQYEKLSGSGKKSLNAPIKEWKGADFTAGLGPIKTTFKVDRPPYEEDGKWRMVVDGNELVRVMP
jgi:hypothetical protein